MKKLFVSALALFLLASCERNDTPEESRIVICFPSADTITYKGQFERSSIAGRTTADVELKFKDGVFVGSSSVNLFPAIGKGIIKSSTANSITFQNQTFWTANFDWSLILDGEFAVRATNDSLILTKFKGNDWVDSYLLKRK